MRSSLIRDDVQLQAKALGDPTRFRIFRYIFDSGCPIGVAELTTYTQLNHNAVRQHLAVLTAAEVVVKEVEERTRPGRPRLLYTPAIEVAGLWGLSSPYEDLATMLSEILLTNASPEEVGRSAGMRRANELSSRPVCDGLSVIEGEMARIGFRPSLRHYPQWAELIFGSCPFASAATANPSAVCRIHRGIAEGLAEGLGGVEVEDLIAKNPHKAGCRLRLNVSGS
jgi:predicted ArsR family transcriptional regulator